MFAKGKNQIVTKNEVNSLRDEYLKVKNDEYEELTRQSKLYIKQSDLPERMKEMLERNIDYLALEAFTHLRRHQRAESRLTEIRKLTNN
jgi:translation elongation factor EF-4